MADKYRGYTLDNKWVYGEKIECKWQGKDIIMIKPENEPFIYPADKDGEFNKDIVEMLDNFVPSKKPFGAERIALACNAVAVIPESVGKWLGKDSNGNDIYEKDKLTYTSANPQKLDYKHTMFATEINIVYMISLMKNNEVILTVDTSYCEIYPFIDNIIDYSEKYNKYKIIREKALYEAQVAGVNKKVVGNYLHLDTTRCWEDYIIVSASHNEICQNWEVAQHNNGLPIARIYAEAYPIYIETLRRVGENDDEQ